MKTINILVHKREPDDYYIMESESSSFHIKIDKTTGAYVYRFGVIGLKQLSGAITTFPMQKVTVPEQLLYRLFKYRHKIQSADFYLLMHSIKTQLNESVQNKG